MAIEGRLSAGGFADLLSALHAQGRTGILDLVLPGTERRFALDGGEIVYLTSSDQAEKLALRLVTRGVASMDAVMLASKAGGDFRQEMARRGLPAEVHDRELAALIEEVVLKTFAATDGKYHFVDRAELGLDGALESVDMTALLWKGARAADPAFAEKYLGQLGQRVLRPGSDDLVTGLSDLTPQEGYLLSRIDGYGSANDILDMSPMPREQALRFLLGLCVIGLIDVQGRPGVKLPRPGKIGSGKAGKKAASPSAKPQAAPAASRPISSAGAIPGLATASAEATPPSQEELEGLDGVRAFHARIQEADHYVILGLKPGASEPDIRKAYYALARHYHPDRFGKELGGKEREIVEETFARISEAWSVLSNDERRRDYDERMKSGELERQKEADRKPVDRKELARDSFGKARTLLAQGDRTRALAFLEHAVEADPDAWDYRMQLAALLMGDTRLRKRAEPHLLEAIRIDQTKAEAYYQLGLLYKMAGVKSRALEQFRAGQKWDALHEGIQAELKGLGEPSGDDASGAGLLGGLFGKKK